MIFILSFKLSDVSSPRSITSTPLSGKESVFFAEPPFKVIPFCVQLILNLKIQNRCDLSGPALGETE